MAGDLNINQITVKTTTADADKIYIGQSPFSVTDDRAITYGNFRAQIISSDTYSGLNTVDKTPQGAINELLASSGSAVGSPTFYLDDTAIVASSAENTLAINTLTTAPVTSTPTVTDSVVVNNSTAAMEAYLYNSALNRTSWEAGEWDLGTFASVSNTAGGASSVISNIYVVIPDAVNTLTTTGTGTSRTATISGGSIFVAGDANANIALSGYLQTPKGLYQITGYTSATEVTIAVPAAYVNETTVAYSKWKFGYSLSTGTLTSTSVILYSLPFAEASIVTNLTDKLGAIYFGRTARTSNTTVSFTHNGTSQYSHFHTSFATMHNDLAGKQLAAAGVTWGHVDDQAQTFAGVKTFSDGMISSYLSLVEGAAPADPASGYARLYIDSAGLTSYKVNHGGSVTIPMTLTAAGVPTFAGLTTNNGILTVNSSGTVSASVTLPDGTLATTQSAGDSSTKLATTAFVANALLWDRTAAGDGFYHVSPINDGTDIVKVTVHGNPATANYNYISEQTINAVSMTGVGNGILFKQYYYDGTTPATSDEGYIGFFTEGNWTSTASTRNSSAKIRPVKNGVSVEGLTISSDGIPTFAGLTTDGGILQSSSAGLISSSTTVAKATAFTLGLSTSGGVLLNEHAVDEPSTGQIMISATTAGELNIGLKHASTLVNVKVSAAGVPTFPGLNVAGGVVTTDTNGVMSSSVTAALPTGTTATTQTANNNSTRIATTAYVDGKTSFAAGLTLGGSLIIPLANRLIIGPDASDGSFSFVISAGHLYAQKYGTGAWGNAGQVQILA